MTILSFFFFVDMQQEPTNNVIRHIRLEDGKRSFKRDLAAISRRPYEHTEQLRGKLQPASSLMWPAYGKRLSISAVKDFSLASPHFPMVVVVNGGGWWWWWWHGLGKNTYCIVVDFSFGRAALLLSAWRLVLPLCR